MRVKRSVKPACVTRYGNVIAIYGNDQTFWRRSAVATDKGKGWYKVKLKSGYHCQKIVK